MDLKSRAKELKTDIPAVFFALKKKETPIPAKILAGIVIAYALSPIDFIPDFIPVIGLLDDIILLPILIAVTRKCIPDELFAQCKAQAGDLWAGGKPKKWYYAIPIILIWAAVILLLVKIILM